MTKRTFYCDEMDYEELYRLEYNEELNYSRRLDVPLIERINRLQTYKRKLEGLLFKHENTDLAHMYRSRYASIRIQKHTLKFDLKMRICKVLL